MARKKATTKRVSGTAKKQAVSRKKSVSKQAVKAAESEKRRAASLKGWETRRKAKATLTPSPVEVYEKRRDAAIKGWETRKRKERKEARKRGRTEQAREGIADLRSKKAHHAKYVRQLIKKEKFANIFETEAASEAADRLKIAERMARRERTRLNHMTKAELLKEIPAEDRKTFKKVPVDMVKQYIMLAYREALGRADAQFTLGLERAAKVLEKKFAKDGYSTEGSVRSDIRRLGMNLTPPADWVVDPVPRMMAEFKSAKTLNERDSIAELLAEETGWRLREVYSTMFGSPTLD
jgi:hypothetical protein